MEDIKLILVDIDGTLINNHDEVTFITRQAIKDVRKKGMLFGIVSGRPPLAIQRKTKDWGIEEDTDIIIGFNGGSHLDMKTGKIESYYSLKGEYIYEILDTFKDFNFNASIQDFNVVYSLKDDQYARNVAYNNKLPLEISDLKRYSDKTVDKLLVMADEHEIERMIDYYTNHVSTDHYKAVRTGKNLYEFFNPELSKSKGIEILCNKMNIALKNVLTFGDEMNDYEMIQDCIGVAMGNANPKIKDAAKYITKSNLEDGIGCFLNEYFK